MDCSPCTLQAHLLQPESPIILIVADDLDVGGLQRQIVELLKGLKQNDHFRVALAVLTHGGALENAAAPLATILLPVQRVARFDPTLLFKFFLQARAARVCLIHAFGWMGILVGSVAARWLRLPIIHGGIRAAAPRLVWHERISRWCALRSDAIVANSRAGLETYGLAQHPRARVIPNGIDLRRFEAIVPEYVDGPTLCMVANFSQYKDQQSVIRAMPRIQRAFPRAKLLLVGQVLREGDILCQCRQLVTELGLSDSIRFVTNTNYPEPFIAGSDVCVLASNYGEGISNAILEYMALGKPVIATDCGGNVEVIRQGETGFLVPGGSSEAIAMRAIELLQDPEGARRMGEAGRIRVQSVFRLERMVQEYEALYTTLLARLCPFIAI